MNPRRIVRTLIVVLVTIVGRWLIRAPLTPIPDPEPMPPPQPLVPVPPTPPQLSQPSRESEPSTEPVGAPHGSQTPELPSPGAIRARASAANVAVLEAPVAAHEAPVAVLEAPTTMLDEPAEVLETRADGPDEPSETYEAPAIELAAHVPSFESRVDAPETSVPAGPDAWSRDWQVPEREHAAAIVDDATAVAPVVDAPQPDVATPEPTYASDRDGIAEPTESSRDIEAPLVRASRRTRRRSEATERPGRLLGGAGFLLAAIACFVASFVLFVRLTTPDRAAPAVYAVVPYVAASERDVPPALASFAGDVDTSDTWLVLRLPVAARYVALTGLRTVDRWTTNRFALAGPKPTLGTNAASCYAGVGVANGPPELTPLPEGSIVRDESTTSLTPERLVRVDVGALLADATSTKTLVCAIASPARVGFASYAATIGVPNVPASDATGSRVRLSALPLAVDYSAFGNASAMRFTQTSLAVATDPLHATLDVAGFETFAYDDPDGDARRDVLLFIAGALATIGAVATADALRPWLGIERR